MESLNEFRAEDLVAEWLRRTGKKEVLPAADIEVHLVAYWEAREIYFAPRTYSRAFYRVAKLMVDRFTEEKRQLIRGKRKTWVTAYKLHAQFTEKDVHLVRRARFEKKKRQPLPPRPAASVGQYPPDLEEPELFGGGK